MSQDVNELSKQPTPDKAEDNAFFPSPYSLSQYTAPKTDFDGVEHKGAYKDGKWKVLREICIIGKWKNVLYG